MDSFLGISRLKGTTLYELYLTHQQRGINWRNSKERNDKAVFSEFKVRTFAFDSCRNHFKFFVVLITYNFVLRFENNFRLQKIIFLNVLKH